MFSPKTDPWRGGAYASQLELIFPRVSHLHTEPRERALPAAANLNKNGREKSTFPDRRILWKCSGPHAPNHKDPFVLEGLVSAVHNPC